MSSETPVDTEKGEIEASESGEKHVDKEDDDEEHDLSEGGVDVKFVTTACGDYHNLAIDTAGHAYSLPSQITLNMSPAGKYSSDQ